ncbi:MAG: hypothetical protein MRERV_12c017 [Mycoplasmataceae bacterium RV_VA103A]|nr:MAG: hypothetical protein MRERV_12c017 [Mycoplasmataceae bacterium RV_VA103A]
MEWKEFKEYLEKNILEKEWERNYYLRPQVKKKYKIKQERELVAALEDLIGNIENKENSSDYYSIPDLAVEEGYIHTTWRLKPWKELFPQRETTFFGPKENFEESGEEIEREDNDENFSPKRVNKEPLSPSTFTIIGQIYEDWRTEVVPVDKLKEMLKDGETMLKFVAEAAVNLNYELIKRKGYDKKLTKWLADYQKLNLEQQKELIDDKNKIEQFLATIKEEEKYRQEQGLNNPWYKNINWKKYGLIGGIVLVAVFIIAWVIKVVRKTFNYF